MSQADEIRRAMVESGKPYFDLAAHDSHEAIPAPGSIRGPEGQVVTNGDYFGEGEVPLPWRAKCTGCGQEITCHDGRPGWWHQTWTTEQMTADFEVLEYAAPYVAVRRKADSVVGTLEFTHSPRVYFDFHELREAST
jgi:hypothetical protein